MRSSWSGKLKVGHIQLFCKAYKSVDSERGASRDIHRHHKDCGGRLGYKKYCKKCGEEISRKDTYRAYHFGKDDYKKLSKEVMEEIEREGSDIRILTTIDIRKIPIFYISRKKYGLVYDEETDEDSKKRYSQIFKALKRTGKALIGKWNYHNRDRLVMIAPFYNKLWLFKLIYEDEVRKNVIGMELELDGTNEEEVKLVSKYLEEKVNGKKLKDIKSNYKEKLEKVLSGEELEIEEEEEEDDVMEAIKQSLEEEEEKEKVKAKVKV